MTRNIASSMFILGIVPTFAGIGVASMQRKTGTAEFITLKQLKSEGDPQMKNG